MENQIKRIDELKKQLHSLGYHSFQIESIVRDIVATTDLSKITYEQSQEIIEQLTEYVQFAQKCRSGKLRK